MNGSVSFEQEPEILLVLDQVARRYNRTPAEVLEMDLWELSLCIACIVQFDATSAQLMKRINADGMPVFPVIQLN